MLWKNPFLALLIFLLAACGGGGSSTPSNTLSTGEDGPQEGSTDTENGAGDAGEDESEDESQEPLVALLHIPDFSETTYADNSASIASIVDIHREWTLRESVYTESYREENAWAEDVVVIERQVQDTAEIRVIIVDEEGEVIAPETTVHARKTSVYFYPEDATDFPVGDNDYLQYTSYDIAGANGFVYTWEENFGVPQIAGVMQGQWAPHGINGPIPDPYSGYWYTEPPGSGGWPEVRAEFRLMELNVESFDHSLSNADRFSIRHWFSGEESCFFEADVWVGSNGALFLMKEYGVDAMTLRVTEIPDPRIVN